MTYKQFCEQYQIFEQGQKLWQSVQARLLLTCTQQQEFGEIDFIRTKGMKLAEKRCCKSKMGNVAWSPELAECCHKLNAWGAIFKA